MIKFRPVELIHETEMAWCVEYEGRTYWLPKSKARLEDDTVYVPEWMAFEKEMI